MVSKSKYFHYKDKHKKILESQVIGNSGTIAILPKIYEGKKVNIRYNDGSTQYGVRVETNATRTFIKIPYCYLGSKVYITLYTL